MTNENITQQADGYLSYQLTKLEPNTYYAFHVQIFTHNKSFVDPQTSSTHKQSPVNFFRTKIDEFSRVFNLRAASKTKDSVTLAWDVVKSEVDLLTHFRVDVIAMPDLPHIIDQRDYCQNPIDYSNQHYGYKQSSKSFKNHDECCQETCNQGNEVSLR